MKSNPNPHFTKETSRYILAAFLFETGGSQGLLAEIGGIPELLLFLKLRSIDLKEVVRHIDSRIQKSKTSTMTDWNRFLTRVRNRISEETSQPNVDCYMRELTKLLSLHYKFPVELVVSKSNDYSITKLHGFTESETTNNSSGSNDYEINQLLKEISEMNWEKELELFRQNIIERKVDLDIEKEFVDAEEKMMKTGAKYGSAILGFCGLFVSKGLIILFSILGFIGLGISLTFLMGAHGFILGLIVIIAGILFTALGVGSLLSVGGLSPIIGGISFALVGALVGAAINLKLQRYLLQAKRETLAIPLRDKHSMLILEPLELLSFWENRASIYIMSRISRIEEQVRLMKKNIQESQTLEKKMERRDAQVASKLRASQRMTQNTIAEALHMKEGLTVLHSRFREKVYDLKALVDQKKEIEKNSYLEAELAGKVQKAIKSGVKLRKSWKKDQSKLHSEIEGMALAFQEQLFQSNDFMQAHMQLESHTQQASNSD